MNKRTLIIGYGTVGSNLAKELSCLEPEIYDKFKPYYTTKKEKNYDFAFICVDTPYSDTYHKCDLFQVYSALEENDADVYVIKSTVLPGTIDTLKMKYPDKHIVFSPEYYGATQHCNNFKFDFTILGGNKEDCIKVQQLLQNVYDGRHIFRIVDAKTAELVKYMENCWLATKVSFCSQFFELANKCEVDYEDLRELFILDPRVNPSHTFIYRDKPYWESHCLNKDVLAIAETYDASLLKEIIRYNEKQK